MRFFLRGPTRAMFLTPKSATHWGLVVCVKLSSTCQRRFGGTRAYFLRRLASWALSRQTPETHAPWVKNVARVGTQEKIAESAYRCISAHIGAYLRISAHICAHRRISAHSCAYWRIRTNTREYARMRTNAYEYVGIRRNTQEYAGIRRNTQDYA